MKTNDIFKRQMSKKEFLLYESEKENNSNENTRKSQSTNKYIHKSRQSNKYNSNKQLYITQLESKVKELEKVVESQKIQIKNLQDEKLCLKLICDKQQIKLLNNQSKDIDILKQQYCREIEYLKQERQKMMEMVSNITSQHQKQIQIYQQQMKSITASHQSSTNQQLNTMMNSYKNLQSQYEELKIKLEKVQEQIFENRNIQKKYMMAMKQIQRLESRQHFISHNSD